MKALLVAIVLAVAGVVRAESTVRGLERIAIAGSDYVRLGEWAEANGFQMNARIRAHAIELTNQAARLKFESDTRSSRNSQIDGVTVWLSLPVVSRGGVPFISVADVETTLQPILFPQKARTRVQTICLDAGHGGKDKGEIDRDNFEKKYTLLLADETRKLLEQAGFKVVLTRSRDEYVELSDRAAAAAHEGADLFVSLHFNSGPKGLHGVEVHCMTPAGMNSGDIGGGRGEHPPYAGNAADARNVLLAFHSLKAITASLPFDDLGVKRARFEVLREVHVPAILIEGGFMTDPADAKKIYDSTLRQRLAQAIVKGITAYKETVEEK